MAQVVVYAAVQVLVVEVVEVLLEQFMVQAPILVTECVFQEDDMEAVKVAVVEMDGIHMTPHQTIKLVL